MNNINTADSKNYSNKSSILKNLSYTLSLIALLNLSYPSEAKIIHTDKFTPEITEVLENPDIVANVEQRAWVKLPTWYTEKIRNFTINNKTLKKEIAAKFTEDFIVKEMKSNRWISRENQLLFIYCAIWYNYDQDFYTWDDWDNNRILEFENVMNNIETCQTRYKNEFISYMQQRSADAQQRSADAQQRSADAIKETMRLDSLRLKQQMLDFYGVYSRNPGIIKQDEIDLMREAAKTFINSCKKYWIDYRAILIKEVWDKKKVDKILKFYDVE